MIMTLLRAIFKTRKKPETEKKTNGVKKAVTRSPDFIDYDGMGNQGRFLL